MFSWNSFDSFPNLSREFRMELVRASNNSLTKATWASYRTAERHIARCRRQTGWSLTLPLEEEDLLQVVLWMRKNRGLQASTINNMLSAMRKVGPRDGESWRALYDRPCRCTRWLGSRHPSYDRQP